MTISRTQSAARKGARKAKRLGHKLADVQFGKEKTIFAVHEDLLCSSSKYFKSKLQKSRKPVEGDCSVCTEDVAGFTQISYLQFLLDLTQKLLSTRPAEGVDMDETLAEHLSLSEEEQEVSED
ncbi:hypothetical protein J4E93_000655 [Alternaria ventricosa]|uniref:uncharacterized protein n=1 Tax=Alternaria ventricosa TaxID=1187951 RepID=UPI0020C4312E|nr:uncharacterized protein J4E93_000655 [Alternaria ventricosa]KAI4655939.1 hypothetical protein J4E93_000655 [Alternaria ventricosa]